MTRFCTQCGQAVSDNYSYCTNCGTPIQTEPQTQSEPQPQYQQPSAQQSVPQQPVGTKPKNYLVLSILATIFCCLPFGIPAIVFSAKVDSSWNAGRYQEAQDASRKAKTGMLVSAITGGVILIAYFALVFYGMYTMGDDFLEELQRYR